MRRNLTSLLKFLCLCLITVLLTAFMYKTFFHGSHSNDGGVAERWMSGDGQSHPRQGAFFSGSAKNVERKKIDWHDYRYIEWEAHRAGVGEHGAAAHTSPEEEGDRRRLFDTNGFNALLSMFIN